MKSTAPVISPVSQLGASHYRIIPRDWKKAPFNTAPRRERRAAWRAGPMKEGISFRDSGVCVQPRLTSEVV